MKKYTANMLYKKCLNLSVSICLFYFIPPDGTEYVIGSICLFVCSLVSTVFKILLLNVV